MFLNLFVNGLTPQEVLAELPDLEADFLGQSLPVFRDLSLNITTS
jgi:hypothetical protein